MPEFNEFTRPDRKRARRIDSTKPFRVELTFTRAQLRKLADKDCSICLGSGVLEDVRPRPCTCCWRER